MCVLRKRDMSVLLTYKKIILCPKKKLSAANQFSTYFYIPLTNTVTFLTGPFWANRKMGSLEEMAHYERKYTQYHAIANPIKLFFLKKYSQNWSSSIHRWKILESIGKNNPSYLTSSQGDNTNSNDTTQVRRNTSEKKMNVKTSNGESKLDEDYSGITPYGEAEKMPTDTESLLFERDPVAMHPWKKKRMNNPHYNIDPSAKTKKIQIYYNCEMTDMERKICKIKKFLRNGNPVDILLICEKQSDCYHKVNQKKEECVKKKINKTNEENTYECGITSICKDKSDFTNSALSLHLSEAKGSPQVNVRVNFLMRHLAKIANVEETFWHVQNGRRVILLKLYPR
ncbi:translation initiation factor IF-3, putative [Plasmodium knowlesi strain H]|uniref:Translation initiation factor IF-3, putative n=2 Tax=Plasmodium knowlesi TaxID=5850 RepID=B3L2B4_PLAKH|nr:translation initiation factor IF-3, putative [Plasmodium knowlesi strain H]OTN68350.1 Uncharacterized protein PKNOH_S03335100 [Plasmodium knowlesi]CAA9987248.1 translation initiation factor IF-3, putative [Plasmodium knowlesi strain H]VVS76722.1 translation initiation factor IF-3, putative [Plasmodium knowlesi strain H]|eukprot:XP_002261870.1 hypothetical protein, conserved in Plasmodium species [Plasmodium knowlesi strain H]